MKLSVPPLIFLALCSTAIHGCDSGPKLVQVSGIVLIDGKPLPLGFVQVAPADYRAASAKINPDGTFTLTTNEPNDGCVKGTHPVAIIALEPLGPSAQKWHAPITVDKPTKDLKIEITWSGGKPFLDKFVKE